jgi:outer membrane protein assembly factor BamB
MPDWTRFRGPNGSGIGEKTTVPAQLTPRDVRWRTELVGEGHSSPVIARGRVFVTTAERGKRHLLCLDTRSGKELWRQSFAYRAYHTHALNSAASATPAVDSERVYSLWAAPEAFIAVAHGHDGKELWQRDLGPFETQHGGATSPIVHEGLLIFSREPENGDGSLLALDARTGQTRWEVKRPSRDAPYSVPLLFTPQNGAPAQLVFSSTAHGVTSVDPKTGRRLWELPDLFPYRCVGSPIAAGGQIIATSGVGNGSRRLVALRPAPGGGGAPQIAWSLTRGAPYVPTPIAVDGLLFLWGDGGIVTCVRPESGQTVWQERVGGTFYGSPVCSAGTLWAVSTQGELVAIAAAPTFRRLGRSDLGAPSNATPALADNTLYLRTVRHLTAVGGRS